MSSHYGAHNRAWMAWRMEERKRKVRRFLYNLWDDLSFLFLMFAVVLATAMGLFMVFHR